MDQITPLAGALSTFGLYSIVAILSIVVVYLYKRTNELNDKVEKIITTQSEKNADLALKVTVALNESTNTIKEIKDILIKRN